MDNGPRSAEVCAPRLENAAADGEDRDREEGENERQQCELQRSAPVTGICRCHARVRLRDDAAERTVYVLYLYRRRGRRLLGTSRTRHSGSHDEHDDRDRQARPDPG